MISKTLVDCKYLRGEIGRTHCRPCLNNTELKVYSCTQFGKCTIGKEVDGTSCCKTCPLNRINSDPIMKSSITWQYGIITVPSRKNDLLIKTMTSLRNAGFTTPYLYVDGAYDGYSHIGSGLQNAGITYRMPKLGVYGNWILTLLDLYIRNPLADKYAIFQDDFLICENTKEYLDSCQFPDKGYLNLYSQTPANEDILERTGYRKGWHLSDQMARGALALIFDNTGVATLVRSPQFSEYLVDKPKWANNSTTNIDGIVMLCLKPQGYKEYIHCPSLTQHLGDRSTIGNYGMKAKTWDHSFNPLSILK